MGNLLVILTTVLSTFLANLETKTMQSDFTVTVAEEVNAPMNYPGTLTMHGELFRITMFGIDAAYDGKTLYMYSAETDELTLSNPLEQELIETNPFLFAKAMADVCNVTEHTTADGMQTIITLTPQDPERLPDGTGRAASAEKGITKFVLRVRNTDLLPLQVEIKEGKKTSTLKLKDPKYVAPLSNYTIEATDFETFVNDLRF